MIVGQNTTIEGSSVVGDLWALRMLLAYRLPSLQWRWHGIGALQAYLHESIARELRVHIWSPTLVLPGMAESGNAHDHRFALRSTVLVGSLRHTEWGLTPDPVGDHELYDFVHARLHTEQNRLAMRRTGERCRVEKRGMTLNEGWRYTFARGAFHSSEPLSDIVVTLVEKVDQRDVSARVVAPVGIPPVPAFSGRLEEHADEVIALIERAEALLMRDS